MMINAGSGYFETAGDIHKSIYQEMESFDCKNLHVFHGIIQCYGVENADCIK